MFTIGADPEIFVRKNDEAVSAHGLIEGTKDKPFPVDGGAVQVDGMALEFNIEPTSATDFEAFNLNIVKVIRNLRSMVPEHNFNIAAVQEFSPECIAEQPKEALELGCDPDYDAYTMKPNPKPDGQVNFRTGAGHIHVGWGADIPVDNERHIEICSGFIKMLDRTVGLYMTCIDRDPRRRELYGKAGAFRPKSYGVEYRTPSNLWIRTRDTRMLAHFLVNRAIARHTAGMEYHPTVSDEEIQHIINTGQHEVARSMLTPILGNTYSRLLDKALKGVK